MESSDIVLYVASKLKIVPGRTALQKLCYFTNVRIRGKIPFKAHYYGPYSTEIARATDALLTFDFIEEKKESGSLSSPWMTASGAVITDWERRSYSLTTGGLAFWQKIPADRRAALTKADDVIEALEKATRLDAKKLATLAKVHFLIHQYHLKATNVDGIVASAALEDWKISDARVERALKTLSSLPL